MSDVIEFTKGCHPDQKWSPGNLLVVDIPHPDRYKAKGKKVFHCSIFFKTDLALVTWFETTSFLSFYFNSILRLAVLMASFATFIFVMILGLLLPVNASEIHFIPHSTESLMFPAVPFQVRSAADSVATVSSNTTTTAAADPTASVLAASEAANVTTSATATISANVASATASNATATCQCSPVARLFLSFHDEINSDQYLQTVTVTETPSAVAKVAKGEKAADKLKKAKANPKAVAAVKKGAEKKAEKADKKADKEVDKEVDAKNATIVQPDPTLSSVNSTASATPVSKPIRRSLLLQRW